jgi:hypothetical protein
MCQSVIKCIVLVQLLSKFRMVPRHVDQSLSEVARSKVLFVKGKSKVSIPNKEPPLEDVLGERRYSSTHS